MYLSAASVGSPTETVEYLSVCSGIEAATVAWQPLGWSAYGFSEIEKFPNAVLQHHYPDTPNYGDMNDFRQWPKASIDVLVGGTPCQSFSVAGLRQGMADPRGNLALVYLALAEQYRPRWLVWENVPGVLSSNGGRDFGSIIGGMVELGYGIAYRVLDAQYFGVPQRRRRVFVVGYLGDWRRATEILFEPSCLRRHPPPSRETGQAVTYDVAPSIRAGGPGFERAGDSRGQDCMIPIAPPLTGNPYGDHESREGLLVPNVANPLTARMHKGINTTADEGQTPIITHSLRGEGFDASEDGTGRGTPLVAAPLTAGSSKPGTSAPGRRQEDDENLVAFAQNQRDEVRLMDKAGALAAEPGAKQQTYVMQERAECENPNAGPDGAGYREGTAYTLEGRGRPQSVAHQMAVRRLTPLECERLQGFPDGYTDIPGASDSGRYKALGNSMAVPVMRWIGERITSVCQEQR